MTVGVYFQKSGRVFRLVSVFPSAWVSAKLVKKLWMNYS